MGSHLMNCAGARYLRNAGSWYYSQYLHVEMLLKQQMRCIDWNIMWTQWRHQENCIGFDCCFTTDNKLTIFTDTISWNSRGSQNGMLRICILTGSGICSGSLSHSKCSMQLGTQMSCYIPSITWQWKKVIPNWCLWVKPKVVRHRFMPLGTQMSCGIPSIKKL